MRLYNEDFIAILICFSQDLSLLFWFCFMDIVLMIINVIHMHIITKHDAILLLNSCPSESHRQDKKAILWNNGIQIVGQLRIIPVKAFIVRIHEIHPKANKNPNWLHNG